MEPLCSVCWRLTHLQCFCWNLKVKPKLSWGRGEEEKQRFLSAAGLCSLCSLCSSAPRIPAFPAASQNWGSGSAAAYLRRAAGPVEHEWSQSFFGSLHPAFYSVRKHCFYLQPRILRWWPLTRGLCVSVSVGERVEGGSKSVLAFAPFLPLAFYVQSCGKKTRANSPWLPPRVASRGTLRGRIYQTLNGDCPTGSLNRSADGFTAQSRVQPIAALPELM